MRNTQLFNRVYGYLAGASIGDAFGIRTENMHYKDIQDQYGRIEHFGPLAPRRKSEQPPLERFYPFGDTMMGMKVYHPLGRWSKEVGVYTDDMRYKLMVCKTILDRGGPITGSDFAEAWLSYRLMAEGAKDPGPTLSWDGPELEYARSVASARKIADTGTRHKPCVPYWDGPVGLMFAGEPDEAARYGYGMAVAVAAALAPGATMETVVEAARTHADTFEDATDFFTAKEFAARLEWIVRIAGDATDVFSLYEPIYRELLVTYPPWRLNFILEMIPAAIGFAVACRGDVRAAIIGATGLGRDADTIASLTGEIVGALYGAQAFPADWVKQVERLNPAPNLPEMAEGLCRLLKSRAEARKAAAEGILGMA